MRMFSGVSVIVLLLACAACEEKPKPDTALATAPSKASYDVTAPAPITASETVTTADGTTTRTFRGDHFDVTMKAPACKTKAGCTAAIHITAKPGYHINEEYPYRFAARPGSGVAYKGKEAPEVFSKAAGDFTKASPTEGTMQVRYEADGSVKKIPLSGLFKMSVCSDAACQIETPTLEVEVPLQG